MVALAISNQVCLQDRVERKIWTFSNWREVGLFLAQSLGLVGGAVLLYWLGPALGMTLIVGGLVTWSLLRNKTVAAKDENGQGKAGEHAAAAESPSHCANPAWLRGGRLGMCIDSAASSVHRQGA